MKLDKYEYIDGYMTAGNMHGPIIKINQNLLKDDVFKLARELAGLYEQNKKDYDPYCFRDYVSILEEMINNYKVGK